VYCVRITPSADGAVSQARRWTWASLRDEETQSASAPVGAACALLPAVRLWDIHQGLFVPRLPMAWGLPPRTPWPAPVLPRAGLIDTQRPPSKHCALQPGDRRAAVESSISTKPKPREWPVSRSWGI
jgi:hypothetical protein